MITRMLAMMLTVVASNVGDTIIVNNPTMAHTIAGHAITIVA